MTGRSRHDERIIAWWGEVAANELHPLHAEAAVMVAALAAAEARAERAEAALQRAQTGLRAAIEGLDLAATKAAPSEPEIHHAVSDPAPTDGRLTDAGSGSLGAEGAPPPEGTA